MTSQPFHLIILGPKLRQELETTMSSGHCPRILTSGSYSSGGPGAQRESHKEEKTMNFVLPTKTPP